MTANQFTAGAGNWAGAGVFAFDRAKMLNGQAATSSILICSGLNTNFGGMLPADLDGSTLPPAGSPAYFFEVDDDVLRRPWAGCDAHLEVPCRLDDTCQLDFRFGRVSLTPCCPSPTLICCRACCWTHAAAFRSRAPRRSWTRIGDRLMFRATYRNFGDHESVMFNHTVLADGTDRAGIRWYEVRKPSTTPAIYQQGTYAPADGNIAGWAAWRRIMWAMSRWATASPAPTMYPSIRYAGRLSTDPPARCRRPKPPSSPAAARRPAPAARWGDYSAMTVDPVDDCTFWYTQEYIQTTGTAPWQTRIASFKFPNCALGPQGTLAGVIINTATSAPIVGAAIQATASVTQSGATSPAAGGAYSMLLLTGTYTVTASAFGFLPKTVSGVSISQNATTTLDLGLDPAPSLRGQRHRARCVGWLAVICQDRYQRLSRRPDLDQSSDWLLQRDVADGGHVFV